MPQTCPTWLAAPYLVFPGASVPWEGTQINPFTALLNPKFVSTYFSQVFFYAMANLIIKTTPWGIYMVPIYQWGNLGSELA